jgi:hypothetical protein
MALIRRNVDQLRQEGIKNAQKRINEQKAFEAQVQALSKHNVGGLYDIREIKKSAELKQTRNFLDGEQAQEELQMLLSRFGLHGFDAQVNEFVKTISGQEPTSYTTRKTAEFIDSLLTQYSLKHDIKVN